MNAKAIVLLVLVVSIVVVGCASKSQTGYATYNQPQQGQYVGGGCGVAPSGNYEDTPIEALGIRNSQL